MNQRTCVSDKVLSNIGAVENIVGFGNLSAEEQDVVRAAFTRGSVAEESYKMGKKATAKKAARKRKAVDDEAAVDEADNEAPLKKVCKVATSKLKTPKVNAAIKADATPKAAAASEKKAFPKKKGSPKKKSSESQAGDVEE